MPATSNESKWSAAREAALAARLDRKRIAQLASITGANRNKLKVRLRELVADGRVRQRGKACATWYTL
ncbi:MAG TPA: hypothetical protein VN702_08575 [Acetobacteraceae bacterium]|nr:hypothetical protein [Acetobacteraceae bacterium]